MPPAASITMTVMLALTCLVMWAVTRANSGEVTDPNPVAGIRTRATMASPQAWQAAHAAALPLILPTGRVAVSVSVAGMICTFFSNPAAMRFIGTGLIIGGYAVLIAGALWITRRANRAARAVGAG